MGGAPSLHHEPGIARDVRRCRGLRASARSGAAAGYVPGRRRFPAVGGQLDLRRVGTPRTKYGVTTITSSVSLRWNESSSGTARPVPARRRCRVAALPFSVVLSCSSPAMAKLWPLASSTVVSARRTVSAGTWIVLLPAASCTAPWVVSALTSGRTLHVDPPTGHHRRHEGKATPYCLNSMLISLFCWPTGIGNSPPTRKLAGSPLMAVRFGSARTWPGCPGPARR